MFTADDLCELLKVSRATLYRRRKRGVLPAPLRIGDAGLRWREDDIALWLDFLSERASEQREGRDPNRLTGPAPPCVSTGEQLFDPRAEVARRAEAAREARRREASAARRAARAENSDIPSGV